MPVRVSGPWNDLDGTAMPVRARSLNVSEGGMALASPVMLEPGSVVTCSLRLGGEPVYLHGEVVWRRRPQRPGEAKRVGVRFSETTAADLAPLRSCLSRLSERLPVRLHFPGVEEPVFALADARGDELELSAPLSLLTDGRELEFEFAHGGPRYLGQVRSVQLDKHGPTPVLHARVAVRGSQRASFRQAMQSLAPTRAARRRRRVEHLLAGVVGFAVGAGLWWLQYGTSSDGADPSTQAVSAHDFASAPLVPVPAAEPEQTASAADGRATAATAEDTPAKADDNVAAVLGPAEPEPARDTQWEPIVERLRDARQVTVRADGEPRVDHVYRLAQPPGIGVRLTGDLKLPAGRYPIHRDRMLWLRVRELPEPGSTQVRLFFADRPEDYEVRSEPERLRLRVPR